MDAEGLVVHASEDQRLAVREARLQRGQRAALAELRLEVADFGRGALALNSYRVLLGRRAHQQVLRAVVDSMVTKERVASREHLLNDLLSLMACHSAVRASDRLSPEAISELLAQRELAQNPHYCPHGLPTSLHFRRHNLERHFKRVQQRSAGFPARLGREISGGMRKCCQDHPW